MYNGGRGKGVVSCGVNVISTVLANMLYQISAVARIYIATRSADN